MPTRLTTNFPPLKDPVEFESLVRDICAFEWGDPQTDKFGRSGQKQYGVDVYGRPIDLGGKYRAAQCKLRTKGEQLTEKQVEAEVAEAKQSPFDLETLIIATDTPRDTQLQAIITKINERELKQGNFRVAIWFWDNITEKLAAYPKLILRYYADYFANLTTLPIVERLIDTPLQVISVKYSPLSQRDFLDEALIFRGIRILKPSQTTSFDNHILNDVFPDGIIFYFQNVCTDEGALTAASFVHNALNSLNLYGGTCPAFLLLPSTMIQAFMKALQDFGGNSQRINLIATDQSTNDIADQILEITLQYGYIRRGGFATIDIAVRSRDNRPDSAFLDLDWCTRLSINTFPTPEEWNDYFLPSLTIVRNQLVKQRDGTRIQMDCQLPLPAAIALGFFFNIRVAKIGIWARKTGVSDFKQQFWLSDGEPANAAFTPEWIKPIDHKPTSAILELTSYVSIHRSVDEFVLTKNIEANGWVEMRLTKNGQSMANIDEGHAVAYASQVGQLIRNLNEKGVTDIHIFARISPSLGVLVGQRLQACGRIHLYWFDNPTYRYGFTLK
jgi:hypothetical protein